jgi:hypothetical protein
MPTWCELPEMARDSQDCCLQMLTLRKVANVLKTSLADCDTHGGAQDRSRIQGFTQLNREAISNLLARVPRPLLLLLKTNDCLRSVDRMLGVKAGVSSIPATARACHDMLSHSNCSAGWWSVLANTWHRLHLELLLLAMRWYSPASL